MRYADTDLTVTDSLIHAPTIFKRELELARSYVNSLPPSLESDVSLCPISGEKREEVFFEKWGQAYYFCPKTWTLALSKAPDQKTLESYFVSSDLAKFRMGSDYQRVITELRREIFFHYCDWIETRVGRYLGSGPWSMQSWGDRYEGLIHELQKLSFLQNFQLVHPLIAEGEQGDPDLNESTDIICLNNSLQRYWDQKSFLRKISKSLRPGGLLIITCRTGVGFDILTLQGQSNTVFPLDHICLPSPTGLQILLESCDFEILESTTPGMIDSEIVLKNKSQIPREQYFQRYIYEQGTKGIEKRLQDFLQINNLSSHLRVVAKKRSLL